MKVLSIPGILSVSKIAIKLLSHSFLLGPLAIVYALVAEALLQANHSVLLNKMELAVLAILVGGFFCSFVCMAASIVILLPLAIYESNRQQTRRGGMHIFQKYLPVPVFLSLVLGLILWMAAEFKPFPAEPMAILISFYLPSCTGLYLMSRQLHTIS
jgi:polyferredoxin